MKNMKRVKIVKIHEEDYLYVIKHAGYKESFADTLRRLKLLAESKAHQAISSV